jgi:uncharacterized protein DUF669
MPKYVQQLDVTLPEGEYDFLVADANEKISQSSGNDMIELRLLIKGPDGEEVRIYDNLVFSNKAFWKIDQFRICTGDKLVAGQEVEFKAEDCLDRTGKAFVTIERFEGRERNKVKEYIAPGAIDKPAPAETRKSQKPVLADDELPLS